MLDIGEIAGNRRHDGSTIKGIVEGLKHNKLFFAGGGNDALDLDVANLIKGIEYAPFARWRVIALSALWSETSTANEDPVFVFGYLTDPDAYGKMTSAITGGEKFNSGDFQKYDPLNILADEVIAEASATLGITWTEGAEFGVWQKTPKDLIVAEDAVAGMTAGRVRCCMVIEVDTGGKW